MNNNKATVLNKLVYKNNSSTPVVYKIIIEDKFYIGGTTRGLASRKSHHMAYLRNKNHKNYKMQELFNLGKEIEFQILEFCAKEDVIAIEQKYLDLYKDNPNCLNICFFAGSVKGVTRSPEHKKAMSEGSKRSWSERPQVFTDERKAKMLKTITEGYASGRLKPHGKGRGPAGSKCALSKLKEEDVLNIYELRRQGLTHKSISEVYNVTREAITMILNGKCWKVLYDKSFKREQNV